MVMCSQRLWGSSRRTSLAYMTCTGMSGNGVRIGTQANTIKSVRRMGWRGIQEAQKMNNRSVWCAAVLGLTAKSTNARRAGAAPSQASATSNVVSGLYCPWTDACGLEHAVDWPSDSAPQHLAHSPLYSGGLRPPLAAHFFFAFFSANSLRYFSGSSLKASRQPEQQT